MKNPWLKYEGWVIALHYLGGDGSRTFYCHQLFHGTGSYTFAFKGDELHNLVSGYTIFGLGYDRHYRDIWKEEEIDIKNVVSLTINMTIKTPPGGYEKPLA